MKNFLLILISFFIIPIANAQDTFFILLNDYTVGSDVIEVEDDFILIGNDNAIEDFPFNHLFQSFNASGDSLDAWRHNNDSIAGRAIHARLDNYTFGMSCNLVDEIIYCYPNFTIYNDDFSDTLFYMNYDFEGVSNFARALWNTDSTFIVLGQGYSDSLNSHFTSLSEMDTLGNILWNQRYFGAFETIFSPADIVKADDGGFIINCGELNLNFQNHNQRSTLIKTDSVGEEELRVEIGDPEFYSLSQTLVKLSSGDIALAYSNDYFAGSTNVNPDATTFIVTMNQELSVLSEASISTFGIDTSSTFPLLIDNSFGLDGEFLFSGQKGDSAMFLKFTDDLELLWQRYYTHPDQDQNDVSDRTRINGIRQADDEGFLLAGTYYATPGSLISDVEVSALVIKVDEFGCIEPGCELLNINEENEELSGIGIYPNPVSNRLRLIIPEDLAVEFDIKIYSALGQLMLFKKDVNNSKEIDVSQLNDGLYILQVYRLDGKSKELKFIKN